MSSYNVKSAPNFQRAFPRSKKSDELQRLKDEYERIKDFSDYTIALRIRQVRLWRLFRKIQDINAVSAIRAKPPRKQPKTYEQMRAEALSRARELGMEFSRENGLHLPRQSPATIKRTSMFRLTEKTVTQSNISTTARRLNYGNVISHENMRRFKTIKRKPLALTSCGNNGLRSASSIAVDRLEKLRNCTTYPSSNASFVVTKSNLHSKKSQESRSGSKTSPKSVDTLKEDSPEKDVIKNYTFILNESSARQSEIISESIEEQEDYLVNLWNELKVRIPILKSVPLKELMKTHRKGLNDIIKAKNSDQMEEQVLGGQSLPDSSHEEYELRKIDNDRNLPTSQLQYNGKKTAVPIDDSTEDKRIMENEKIVKISNLIDNDDTCYYNPQDSEKEGLKSTSSSTECAVCTLVVNEQKEKKVSPHPSLKNKPLTSLDLRASQNPMLLETHVEDYVKLYEPFPRFHQTEDQQTVKENNYESGVVKLRSIFEHQGE